MTVCTNDVALGDLVEDRLPVTVAEALSDAEALVAQVVELEHERIALAAVDAGVLVEEADGKPPARQRRPSSVAARWRGSGRDSPRSAPACTRRGKLGSSCRAGHVPVVARQIRRTAWSRRIFRTTESTSRSLTRTYVRNHTGRRHDP